MPLIRPCADLRNNYNEISKICHETKQPVYITKNGYNDLVVLSNEAYEEYDEIQKWLQNAKQEGLSRGGINSQLNNGYTKDEIGRFNGNKKR